MTSIPLTSIVVTSKTEHFKRSLYPVVLTNEFTYVFRGVQECFNMKKDNMLWKATVEHAEQCDLEGNYKLKSYRVEEKHVTLFFNCVHDLVGAKFRGRYVAKDNFSSDEKVYVDN